LKRAAPKILDEKSIFKSAFDGREGQVKMQEDEPKELSPAWFQWIERKHAGELPQWMLEVQAKPCMWEYRPAFWTPGEAWAVIDGTWEAVNSGDVGMNARPLTLKMLDVLFPGTPPLPPEAFNRPKA
jgi:hypothetical protein